MNHEQNQLTREMTQFLQDVVEYAKRLKDYYEMESRGLLDADTPKPAPPVYGQPF